MKPWRVVFTRQARKDAKKLSAAGLRPKAEYLLSILKKDPFASPPPFAKLVGDLRGAFSRRINVQHRLVYQVIEEERAVKVIRTLTGHLLADSGRELALSWDEIEGVLELKAFEIGPQGRAVCLRGCGWGLAPATSALEAELEGAAERLAAALNR